MKRSTKRARHILDVVDDLAGKFLYYDRKGDEDLPRGEIESALIAGEISLDEILQKFRDALECNLPEEAVKS